jgi:glycosyltransferase involved in cell wall biosynthesis
MDSIELVKTENGYLPKLIDNNYYPTISLVTITYERHHIFDIAVFNWTKFIYPSDKIEWIILDDSSKKSSEKLKSKLPQDSRIKYYHVDKIYNIGLKRNKAVELTNHEIILHIDDDDYYPPDSLINRVLALSTYNKKCVGCSSVNCINILNNTCFKTTGGIINNELYIGEASMGYYKSFWLDKKFKDDDKYEECKYFLDGRLKNYIDINSAFVMLAITHSKNMSVRTLLHNKVTHNFFNDLPASVTSIIEKIQMNVYMEIPEVLQGLQFINKNKNNKSTEILKKIKNLDPKIQSTPLMYSYIEEICEQEKLNENDLYVLYFPGENINIIREVNNNNLDCYILQLHEYLKLYNKYKIKVFCYTLTQFKIDNIWYLPWFYFNKKRAAGTIIYVDEISHKKTYGNNCNKSIFLNLNNIFYDVEGVNYIHTFSNLKFYDKSIKFKYKMLKDNKIELVKNQISVESINDEELEKLNKNFEIIHDSIYNPVKVNTYYNVKSEYFYLKFIDIPLMIYLISIGVKYVCIKPTFLTKVFGILCINDKIPDNYVDILKNKMIIFLNK